MRQKTEYLHLRLTPDLKERIGALAARRGTTVTALIEKHFEALLKEEEQSFEPEQA